MCTAIAVLDAVRDSGQVPPERFGERRRADLVLRQRRACGSSRRCARCAPSSQLWDELTRDALRRHRPDAAAVPLRRAGQLARPDRGPAREQRPADRAGDARRDPVQGRPGPRGPAAGLERGARACPGRGTSSGRLRMQQVLAYESDLLEYDDLFAGSLVVEAKVAELRRGRPRRDRPRAGDGRRGRGGRERLHEVGAGRPRTPARRQRIEAGEDVVVGVNRFETHRAQPADRRPRHRDPDRRPRRRGQRPSAAVRAVARGP